MATITTSNGDRTVNTTMTDAQAVLVCDRIPVNHKDKSFGASLSRDFRRFGNLTPNKRVWLHILANAQVARETPAAPVAAPAVKTMTAALPAPAAPVVPATPAPVMSADELDNAAAGLRLTMLMYDIPEVADIANPSGRLRRIGVRINKSVWVVPTNKIPYNLIHELQAAGADVHTADYDATASAGLIRVAVGVMNKELAEAQKRAEVSAAEALAEMNNATGNPHRARTVYNRKIANIVKRLEALAEELADGANVFGITRAVNFAGMRNVAVAMQGTLTAKAAVYAKATQTLATMGTSEAASMSDFAAADDMDPMIAADFIEENGDADTAREIRATFEPETFSND